MVSGADRDVASVLMVEELGMGVDIKMEYKVDFHTGVGRH